MTTVSISASYSYPKGADIAPNFPEADNNVSMVQGNPNHSHETIANHLILDFGKAGKGLADVNYKIQQTLLKEQASLTETEARHTISAQANHLRSLEEKRRAQEKKFQAAIISGVGASASQVVGATRQTKNTVDSIKSSSNVQKSQIKAHNDLNHAKLSGVSPTLKSGIGNNNDAMSQNLAAKAKMKIDAAGFELANIDSTSRAKSTRIAAATTVGTESAMMTAKNTEKNAELENIKSRNSEFEKDTANKGAEAAKAQRDSVQRNADKVAENAARTMDYYASLGRSR